MSSIFRFVSAIPTGIGLVAVGLFAQSCGEAGVELVDEETAYYSMLTGEQCDPQEATFQEREDSLNDGHSGDGAGGGDGCQGDCTANAEGEAAREQLREQQRLQCGPHYFHRDDFPQPGCDGEGCCQIRIEDVEQVQNRERIQCQCRARFQGEIDSSSLPDCCADRPERQCEPDDGVSEDEPAQDEPAQDEPAQDEPAQDEESV